MYQPVNKRIWLAYSWALLMSCSVSEQEAVLFEMVKVDDGVYAAIAMPTYKLNGNAAVIINEDDVLVVDSHSTPSSARALIKQIENLTSNPVRYVVNTHFHYDHARGNQAYMPPYPHEVTIISTEGTRENLINIETERLKSEVEKMPGVIANLKKELAKDNDPAKRKRLNDAEKYYEELKTMKIILPTITFDKSLIMHKKNRDIYILFLGRGHTSSDVIVYLAKGKVIVTGDLVSGWVPGMGDGYPNEWINTLDELAKLDIESIIGGHGGVASKRLITVLRSYIADLIAAVKVEVSKGLSLEETQRVVLEQLTSKYSVEYPPEDFDRRVLANITKVYNDVKANLN